jgi:hypothetical protein
MVPQDQLILFRVAQWVDGGNRKVVKTIRQLAETEENYQVIIREIDRVEAELGRARTLGAAAALTLVEWLITLVDFDWRCAYCQSRPFQVMSHVTPLPRGGTVLENCVPACYRCSTYKKMNLFGFEFKRILPTENTGMKTREGKTFALNISLFHKSTMLFFPKTILLERFCLPSWP